MTPDEILDIVLERAEEIGELPATEQEAALAILWARHRRLTLLLGFPSKEGRHIADEMDAAVRAALEMNDMAARPPQLH